MGGGGGGEKKIEKDRERSVENRKDKVRGGTEIKSRQIVKYKIKQTGTLGVISTTGIIDRQTDKWSRGRQTDKGGN